MSKIIITRDGNKYKRVSRWIKLNVKEITSKHKLFNYADSYDCEPGKAILIYFRHDNKEYALGQFMNLQVPEIWEEKDGLHYLNGYDTEQWYKPFLMEIDDISGEMIRLYIEVE